MAGGIDLRGIPTGLSLKPGYSLFQIFRVKVQRVLRRIAVVDAANGQIEIRRKNIGLERDAIADLPFVLIRESYINNASGAVVLPRFQLLFRNDLVGSNLQILFRIGCHLREEMLRTVVDVASSIPGEGHHRIDSLHGPYLFPIVLRKEESQ